MLLVPAREFLIFSVQKRDPFLIVLAFVFPYQFVRFQSSLMPIAAFFNSEPCG